MALSAIGYSKTFYDAPSADVTDFTLIVDLSNEVADYWTENDTADGTKGRAATDSGPTELATDPIDFDNGAETGLLRIFVGNIFAAASEATRTIRVYPPVAATASYGPSDTYGSDNAYDSSWEGYWPNGGGTDRTSNAIALTAAGSPSVGGVAGQIGAATDLDGTTQRFSSTAAGLLSVPNANMTVIIWSNNDVAGQSDTVIGWDGTDDLAILPNDTFGGDGDLRVFWRDAGTNIINVEGVDLAGSWIQTAFVRRGNTDHEGYTNGASVGTSAGDASGSGPFSTFGIGTRGNAAEWFDGKEQEVQLHTTNRTDPWIASEYAQTNDNATFWGTWTWVPVAGGVVTPYYYEKLLQGAA